MAADRVRHPVSKALDFDNHVAMAAHWGDECVAAMRRAIATPHYRTIVDLELEHAVRSAKMTIWHAMKAKGWKTYAGPK